MKRPTNRIIVSLASVNIEKIDPRINKIKNVVSSAIYYDKPLDFNQIVQHSDVRVSLLLGKYKYIVLNIGIEYPMLPHLVFETSFIKVINLNIISFIELLKIDILGYIIHLLSTLDEESSQRDYLINEELKKMLNKNFNSDVAKLIKNFNYLTKIKLLRYIKFKNENINIRNIKYNTIFIFQDISWSNIVFLFKTAGISLYGGSGNKRHLLSTVQANLMRFLLFIDSFEIDYNLIFRSYNRSDTSAKIDRNLIKNFNYDTLNDKKIIQHNNSVDSNQNFYRKFCFISRIYSILDSNLKKYININKRLNSLYKSINSEQDRITSFSTTQKQMSYASRKISNASIKINTFNADIIILTKELNLVKDKINENVEKLYDLDNNLFDDRGVCKLDSRLRLDYQDNQPLKIQLENKIFKE